MKAPSEEIYSKSTICDFLLMVNSNRERITKYFRVCMLKVTIFVHCILLVDTKLAEERPAIST